MAAARAYVDMFFRVCKNEKNDILNTQLINQWCSSEGIGAIKHISDIYSSLVSEIAVVLELKRTQPVKVKLKEFKNREILWKTAVNLNKALRRFFPL